MQEEQSTTTQEILTTKQTVANIQITNAQLVRKCIQEMNTDALYYLLDVERTYQNWKRNEFILKLERIIEQFEVDGDTYLTPCKVPAAALALRGKTATSLLATIARTT